MNQESLVFKHRSVKEEKNGIQIMQRKEKIVKDRENRKLTREEILQYKEKDRRLNHVKKGKDVRRTVKNREDKKWAKKEIMQYKTR